MKNTAELTAYTAKGVSLTLNETYPDSTYGAVPTLDQYDTEETYSSFEDLDLDAVPGVLDAYLDHHQRQWL